MTTNTNAPAAFTRLSLFETVTEDRLVFTPAKAHKDLIATIKSESARTLMSGITKVRWTKDRTYEIGSGRSKVLRVLDAPGLLESGARLITETPKASFYLNADAPDGVKAALGPWIESRESKAKADLMTLVKRPGKAIDLEVLAEYQPRKLWDKTRTGRRLKSRRIDDLGQWVLTDRDYSRLQETLNLGSRQEAFQGTVLFSTGVYFKGTFVSAELSGMKPGFYGGLKAPKGVAPTAEGASVVYASLMDAYAAGPWSCTVNTQQLAYIGTGGFALKGDDVVSRRTAEKLALAEVGIPDARRAANRELLAATHKASHKTKVRGFAGKVVAVQREKTDAQFVLFLSEKTAAKRGLSTGDRFEAAFGWSPFLATHRHLPAVVVEVEVRKDLNGPHLIGVNVTGESGFMVKLFINHAGRDTDGDGVVLVTDRRVLELATPWREITLTNSVAHKATVEDDPFATVEGAIREALRRQLAASEVGKADLMARRIRLHAAGYVDQITRSEKATRLHVKAEALAPQFEAWIQLGISSMKKLIEEAAFAAVKGEIFSRFDESAWEEYKRMSTCDLAGGIIPCFIPDLQKASVKAAKEVTKALERREQAAVEYRSAKADKHETRQARAIEAGKKAKEDVVHYAGVLDRILTALADEAQARRASDTSVSDGLATVQTQRQILSLVSTKDRSASVVGKLRVRGNELRLLAGDEALDQALFHLCRIKALWDGVAAAYKARGEEEDATAVVYDEAVTEIRGIVATMFESCGDAATFGALLGSNGIARALYSEVLTLDRLRRLDALPSERIGLTVLTGYPVPVCRKADGVEVGMLLTRGELAAKAVFGASVSILPKADAYRVVEVRTDTESIVERKRSDAMGSVLIVAPVTA
jgi:hypothetical protein